MDGEVADSVDTALPGSARAAAENTEENSDPNADAKSAGEWEMPGETKESSVPLGTMQNPTTEEEAAASEMAATEAMAAGEKTEEKAEAEAGAENEAGWEMAGETKESEVPLGTMQNPAADVTEGESRVADAIAQNSAVGVSSAEANAESSAATKEADKKAKERAVPGWADNIEAAGETKESKVPLGTMQHPWDGNGWAQEAQEEGSQEGQAATASTELSEKRLPPQPPMDGEVADSVDTALPGSARAAAENTEENS